MSSVNILLIISGSIAAYKSLELIRILKSQQHNVTCVVTEHAKNFVTPLSLTALSGNPVYEAMFESEMSHIKLSRDNDLILVAPATANIIAKTVAGFADDLATSLLLARNKPVIFAPAMNTQMWENNATQRNIAQLLADGILLIPPVFGDLACGEVGIGKMAEPEQISQFIQTVVT